MRFLRSVLSSFLFTVLIFGGSGCAKHYPYYPPMPEPTPAPTPVDPTPTPTPTPTPVPEGALDPAKFTPFVKYKTTLDEVKASVGTGTGPAEGKADDQGALWFYYLVAIPGYPDATLGFRKGPTGTWVLFAKHVGY